MMGDLLPLTLVLGVMITSVILLVLTIRHEGETTRQRNQAHSETLRAKLEEIHTLTNSNLTSVKAALEQANQKISSLEESLVTSAAGRQQAEDQLKRQQP